MQVINKKRAEKPEARKASREAALRYALTCDDSLPEQAVLCGLLPVCALWEHQDV